MSESVISRPVLLIDKPTGWTSHDVVNKVRRLSKTKRVGHAGTLDPLATGLLIILVGRENTRHQEEFLKQDKSYQCLIELGKVSDTYDRDGQITTQAWWSTLATVTAQDVEKILPNFTGTIEQTVPIYSAVKVQGKKLYDYARQAQNPQSPTQPEQVPALPSRQVTINSLEIRDFVRDEVAQTVTFNLLVTCSSGTYIRSLVHDIGQALGVGALVLELRRTAIGEFSINDAIPLASLTPEHFQK